MSVARRGSGAGDRANGAAEPLAAARILIVDDQRFDRMRIKRLCGGLDFPVSLTEAESLAALGQQLDEGAFDLILLDYNLPDGDGLRGLQMIRAHPHNGGVATVMVTGTEQSDVAIEALRGGCSDYIAKDELSQSTLRRSAFHALHKTALQLSVATQEQKRTELQSVLRRFTEECAQDIKPMVNESMRALCALDRSNPAAVAEALGKVDYTFLRLWEFVEDLASYQGSDLAERDLADPPKPAPGLGAGWGGRAAAYRGRGRADR
ncbi:response regulator [Sulfitobacter sp. KE34]|uniref:Response regulator n=1 Tax=Sulfitobacter faviae TaxID=1775881 RepID=A0AAX3LRG5_9RHOB|nr:MULTISPECIES: response regulator [Sulfitobacter]MDF3351548.1 response regulator [Sulfitobacter sp. KE12]MDF3355220.1 response regulator [Sulfitobacter sp. KE27]MDF3358868.1 response regulator [Sulfitobacter sp. KE33]MDF3362545.1 response regulator [Sulfitobacter sp. Ks41]MDF3366292.1 response regulator [Sulfitobacter sp. Ks34]